MINHFTILTLLGGIQHVTIPLFSSLPLSLFLPPFLPPSPSFHQCEHNQKQKQMLLSLAKVEMKRQEINKQLQQASPLHIA